MPRPFFKRGEFMSILKLAIGNIKKSMKDFTIYFVTLLFGICLFYIFNSIDSQSSMLRLKNSSRVIVEMLIEILSYISVFIAVVLGFLIVYASRFMMKRRNKEFAIYMLLGMGKGKVSLVLFVENIIIGIFSLGLGLLSGIGFSQITSVFVAYLFEADLTGYKFVFSIYAFKKTLFYFAIIYAVVILLNTLMISHCKLITLIQSGKRSEKIRNKHMRLKISGFIAGIVILGRAYYLALNLSENLSMKRLLHAVILGIVGTIVVFWAISGIILTIFKRNNKKYYKGLNSFVIRQFSSQASTNVISISIICILFFVTICSLSSAFNIRNTLNKRLGKYCSGDFEFLIEGSDNLMENAKNQLPQLDEYVKEKVVASAISNLVVETRDDETVDTAEIIFSESEYNKIADFLGCEKIHVNKDEFAFVCNVERIKAEYERLIKEIKAIKVDGKMLYAISDKAYDGYYLMSDTATNFGFIVISDEVASEMKPSQLIYIGRYDKEIGYDEDELGEKVMDVYSKKIISTVRDLNEDGSCQYMSYFITKDEVKRSSIGTGAIATFVALYIGFIFLLSGAAILAIKELSESVDNKSRYQMLRKLGADERMINRALFRQIGYFFLFPLILAIIHSVPGMIFSKSVMEEIGTEELGGALLITTAIFAVIYGTYFFITYNTSKRMIREK